MLRPNQFNSKSFIESFTVFAIFINLATAASPAAPSELDGKVDWLYAPIPENISETEQIEVQHFASNPKPMQCSTMHSTEIGVENNAVTVKAMLWKRFNVYIEPQFSRNTVTLINNAMYRLSKVVPCIKFGIFKTNARPSGNFVHITQGRRGECSAWIGMRGGAQSLKLGEGCFTVDIIIHEMMHALGVHHEQNRPDRDDFVNIHWGNIVRGMEHNFQIADPNTVSTFGVAYNYRSIMHYDSTAFSINGRPTIEAKDGRVVGPGGLQKTDILKLQRMYGCNV